MQFTTKVFFLFCLFFFLFSFFLFFVIHFSELLVHRRSVVEIAEVEMTAKFKGIKKNKKRKGGKKNKSLAFYLMMRWYWSEGEPTYLLTSRQ